MRILVFGHDSSLYGASQSLLTLLSSLKDDYHHEILLLLPYPGKVEQLLVANKIPYQVIGFPRCVYRTRNRYNWIRHIKETIQYNKKRKAAFPVLCKLFEDFKPELVYTNTSVVSLGFDLSGKFELPHIWHIREFGWEDYNFKYMPSKTAILNNINHSKKVIFISLALRQAWHNINKKNALVVYNGLLEGNRIFQPRKLPQRKIRLAVLAAVVPGKGQHIAIEAICGLSTNCPDVSLSIFGDPVDREYYNTLKLKCDKYGLNGKVNFYTFQTDKDKIFDEIDILLNCSLMEGFGRSIVEAMERGIPVIANNSGGVPEIIADGVDGLLFNGDAENLRLAIEHLISTKGLYETISRNSIQKANQNFTTKKYSETINKAFLEVSASVL